MTIHYLGIRHHGAGSAARVVKALADIQPDCVLIEGAADCSDLLPLLAEKEMRPPVALLAYAADAPEQNIYYPFATFSPEYQAAIWALEQQKTVAFIDLPISVLLASRLEEENGATEGEEEPPASPDADFSRDPIGAMAQLAGYEDGEAWWNDYLEQNADDSLALFNSIGEMMGELRAAFPEQIEGKALPETNHAREAFMRLQIAEFGKKYDNIAVICGAWHVPALKEKRPQKEDKAIIKNLPKKLPASKVKMTWIPWTSSRLSQQSGYGAGIAAPMWYQHLWQYRHHPDQMALWIGKITHALRAEGQVISTASVIEAVRLSQALAAVRGRPAAGFEEMIDAVISCLCFGEKLLWAQIEPEILLGKEVGSIPPSAPLAPLLADLQQQQKLCKLKPEALERELALDLRSESGNRRSLLLHRLNILSVPWGELLDAGSSRGTFREKWTLAWQPEYSVQLVENLIYGNTIEQAANGKTIEKMRQSPLLDELAELVNVSLIAQLQEAAEEGLQQLDIQASHSDSAATLLAALPPLIQANRYGTARVIDLEHLGRLIERLTVQTALALPHACRHLNADEAENYRGRLQACHAAILLAELPADIMETWWGALQEIIDYPDSNLLLAGLSTRLLYQGEQLSAEKVQFYLQRVLSPAIPTLDAAQYFDGFFSQSVRMLQYDTELLQMVEAWILSLPEDDFLSQLPLFKRVFADLDSTERQRLLQTILGLERKSALHFTPATFADNWQEQLSAALNGTVILDSNEQLHLAQTLLGLKKQPPLHFTPTTFADLWQAHLSTLGILLQE